MPTVCIYATYRSYMFVIVNSFSQLLFRQFCNSISSGITSPWCLLTLEIYARKMLHASPCVHHKRAIKEANDLLGHKGGGTAELEWRRSQWLVFKQTREIHFSRNEWIIVISILINSGYNFGHNCAALGEKESRCLLAGLVSQRHNGIQTEN